MASSNAPEDRGVHEVSVRELIGQGRVDAAGAWAHALLDAVATEGFYGEITFQFQNGKAYLARRYETIKPKA